MLGVNTRTFQFATLAIQKRRLTMKTKLKGECIDPFLQRIEPDLKQTAHMANWKYWCRECGQFLGKELEDNKCVWCIDHPDSLL